jgi:hypothetical protein
LCKTCPMDTFSIIGAHNCSNCTMDYCLTGEYRKRCFPGSTADAQCLKCRTYTLCTSKPCFPTAPAVITDAELEHTKFVGHGFYNDSCPEQCRAPFFLNCQTGSPSPAQLAPQIAQANLHAPCKTQPGATVALKTPLCSLPPSFCLLNRPLQALRPRSSISLYGGVTGRRCIGCRCVRRSFDRRSEKKNRV